MNTNLKPYALSWMDENRALKSELFYCYSWAEAIRVTSEYIRYNLDVDCRYIELEDGNGKKHKFHSIREELDEQEEMIADAKAHLGKALSEVRAALDKIRELSEKNLPKKSIAKDLAKLDTNVDEFCDKLLTLACETEYIQNCF